MQWNFNLYQVCGMVAAVLVAIPRIPKKEYNLKASWLVPNSHEDMIPKTMVCKFGYNDKVAVTSTGNTYTLIGTIGICASRYE